MTTVCAVHGLLIILTLVIPLKGCSSRKKPEEIIINVGFVAPPEVETVAALPSPEQTPKPAKKAPEPKPDPTPSPTPKPKPKPQNKLTKPSEIEIGPMLRSPAPAQTTSTDNDLKQALQEIASSSSKVAAQSKASTFNQYGLSVQHAIYRVWSQPSFGGPGSIDFYMDKNGRILKTRLSQSSGDPAFDQSMLDAAQSISMLPRPPKGFIDRFGGVVTVIFEIEK